MSQANFIVNAIVPKQVLVDTATRPNDRYNILNALIRAIFKAGEQK